MVDEGQISEWLEIVLYCIVFSFIENS